MPMPARQPIAVTRRIDTRVEIVNCRNGGILHTVLRNMAKG